MPACARGQIDPLAFLRRALGAICTASSRTTVHWSSSGNGLYGHPDARRILCSSVVNRSNRFQLEGLAPPGKKHALLRDEEMVLRVDGTCLEDQFELDDGRGLVWLTEDCPYDEGLHIYLFATDGSLEDSIEAGAAFAPGILSIRSFGSSSVDFSFFENDVTYRLEVSDFKIRIASLEGWRYKSKLQRHCIFVRVLQDSDE